jgi:hypothetical protein
LLFIAGTWTAKKSKNISKKEEIFLNSTASRPDFGPASLLTNYIRKIPRK